ncbi:hypothetical protein ACOSQ4_007654 [Xanthoceras sorbifolium]
MERKKKEKIMHIPDEIVFSILGRLPPKSLVRFKCIWKSWESFVNQYKYHNQKLIVLTDTSIQSIDFEADEIEAVDLHIPFKASGFLVNEALYWEISYKNEHYKGCNAVLCYDTLQSKFDVFLPPDNVDVFDILGNIKGRLCIVNHNHKKSQIDIWTKEGGENQHWFKFMSLPRFERILPRDSLRPMCFIKNDEILINVRGQRIFSRLQRRKQFFFYSPARETCKIFQIPNISLNFDHEITYTERLVSP